MGTKKLFTSDVNGNALLCYGNKQKDIVISILSGHLEDKISVILNEDEIKELIIELEALIIKMNNHG